MPPAYLLGRRTASYSNGGLGVVARSETDARKAHIPLLASKEPRQAIIDGIAKRWRVSDREASASTVVPLIPIAAEDTPQSTTFAEPLFSTDYPDDVVATSRGALVDGSSPPFSGQGSGATATMDTVAATEASPMATPEPPFITPTSALTTLETLAPATEAGSTSSSEQIPSPTGDILWPVLPTLSVTQPGLTSTRLAETESTLMLPVETISVPGPTATDAPVITQAPVTKPFAQSPVAPSLDPESTGETSYTPVSETLVPSLTVRPSGASTAIDADLTLAPPEIEASGESLAAAPLTEAVHMDTKPASQQITSVAQVSVNSESSVPSAMTSLPTTPSDAPPAGSGISSDSPGSGGIPDITTLVPRPSGVILQAPRPDVTGLTADARLEALTISSFEESAVVPLSVTSAIVSTFTSEVPIQTTTDGNGRLTTSFSTTTGTTTRFTVVPNPSVSATSGSRSDAKKQEVIGGVVGGLIFLLLSFAFLACICTRRRKYRREMNRHARLFESPSQAGDKFDSGLTIPQVVQVCYFSGTPEESDKAIAIGATDAYSPSLPVTVSPPNRPHGHYVLRKPPPSVYDDEPFAEPAPLSPRSPTGRYIPHHLAARSHPLRSSYATGGGKIGGDLNPFADPVGLTSKANLFDDSDSSAPIKYLKSLSDKSDGGGTSVSYDDDSPGIVQVGYAL